MQVPIIYKITTVSWIKLFLFMIIKKKMDGSRSTQSKLGVYMSRKPNNFRLDSNWDPPTFKESNEDFLLIILILITYNKQWFFQVGTGTKWYNLLYIPDTKHRTNSTLPLLSLTNFDERMMVT